MVNGTYQETLDAEYENEELDYQMQLELERRNRQQKRSRLSYLREKVKEEAKEEVKRRVKQQAKKLASRAARAAARAVTRVLFQLLMTVVRTAVIFLVATPAGWVVDFVILATILSILVVANPGGTLDIAYSIFCGGAELAAGGDLCAAGEWVYGAGHDVGVFFGGKGNPLY